MRLSMNTFLTPDIYFKVVGSSACHSVDAEKPYLVVGGGLDT